MRRSIKPLLGQFTVKQTPARFELVTYTTGIILFAILFIALKNSDRSPAGITPIDLGLLVATFLFLVMGEIRLGIGVVSGYRDYKLWQILVNIASASVFLILGFTWIYWQLSAHANTCMNTSLTKIDSLYFTITTLATVGYGDIHPHSQTCKLVASGQMLADILLVGFVLALIVARIASNLNQPSEPKTDDSTAK